MAKKKKQRVMEMSQLRKAIIRAVSEKAEELEKAFGSIDKPMMQAFRISSKPMIADIKSFMSRHHRSGDTIGSFNPGVVVESGEANLYYFKFGFDMRKGGFPALILEYGDKGTPSRTPNKAYYFLYYTQRDHADEVYKSIQKELDNILKRIED